MNCYDSLSSLCQKLITRTGLPLTVEKRSRYHESKTVNVFNTDAPKSQAIRFVFDNNTLTIRWKVNKEFFLSDPDVIPKMKLYLSRIMGEQVQTRRKALEKKIDKLQDELKEVNRLLEKYSS